MNIKDFLTYNKDTGEFFWIKKSAPSCNMQRPAGSLQAKGYLVISFNKKVYRLNRLAWFYFYGKWPKHQIDHINGIKTDNRIKNLRDVTNRDNQINKEIHRKGRLCGCHYHKTAKKWCSQIKINGKRHYLGLFNSEIEAHKAYMKKYNDFLAV